MLDWLKASTKVKRWIFIILIGIALVCYAFTQVLTMDVVQVSDVVKIVIEFVIRFYIYYIGNYIYSEKKFRNINRSE